MASEDLLQKVTLRLAARHVLAAFSMDALARLSFLEGVAGVPPGTWIRRKAQGFGDADEWAASKDGGLHPNWSTNRNTGMYDEAAKAVASILRGVSGIDPEDLAQEIVSESSLPGGRANRRQFYSAGQAIGKDRPKVQALLEGDLTPAQVRGIAATGAKRLALNEKKRLREKMEVGVPSQEGERDSFIQQQPTVSVDDPNVRENILLMALNSPQSFPGGTKIRAILDNAIDRVFGRKPEKAELMKEFFRELGKGKTKYRLPNKSQLSALNKDPSYFYRVVMKQVGNQAARNLGISNDTGVVTKTFGSGGKNVEKFIEDHVARNPAIQKVVDKILDDLEFSTEFAFGARVGKKSDEDVVELFYRQPKYAPDLPEDQIPLEPWFSFSDTEPNEYMNFDLMEQDDVMGEPRSHMAARVAQRWLLR